VQRGWLALPRGAGARVLLSHDSPARNDSYVALRAAAQSWRSSSGSTATAPAGVQVDQLHRQFCPSQCNHGLDRSPGRLTPAITEYPRCQPALLHNVVGANTSNSSLRSYFIHIWHMAFWLPALFHAENPRSCPTLSDVRPGCRESQCLDPRAS